MANESITNEMLNITNCDVGFSISGTNYTFQNIDVVAIEDPRKRHLIRGANSTSKKGLSYKEGHGNPFTATLTLKGISDAFRQLLEDNFNNDERLDFWVIDRKSGSNKMFKDANLQNVPQQLNISEGEDSLAVELVIETFNFDSDYRAE